MVTVTDIFLLKVKVCTCPDLLKIDVISQTLRVGVSCVSEVHLRQQLQAVSYCSGSYMNFCSAHRVFLDRTDRILYILFSRLHAINFSIWTERNCVNRFTTDRVTFVETFRKPSTVLRSLICFRRFFCLFLFLRFSFTGTTNSVFM